MRLPLLLLLFALSTAVRLWAGGAPSTYFNIYVPPNNDPVQRNVALIVTAIYDNTFFQIVDDNADGDDDDSVSGILQAGQSYILYIKDNGINDDARYASGGTLKADGDYFIINSDKNVFASMSTDSDWQHDFVPAVNKTSLGQKFIIYAPKISNSKRDLNVFAFEDNTAVTISKISSQATLQTGYTNIDLDNKTIVRQRSLNRGQDIVHFFQDGRDVMESGETYMIESNKPVSVQYGALWGNARDGGGYVPSSNGSSSGSLFYFAVPYQAVGEQEIRYVSWDDNNAVTLERYDNGNWVTMKSQNLNRLKYGDWIGKQNGNVAHAAVFRIQCTPGKRVSVFECNWMETGSPGTSDMASMISSEAGTDSGQEFLVYLLPPGKQDNVVNPFTSSVFGGSFSHCYLFADNQNANVTIKDAKTNGNVISRTYQVEAGRYADAFFSLAEWRSLYNGDGNPNSGPDRPYLLIESDAPISVMSANTNDNWMLYFGSSRENAFGMTGSSAQTMAIPGDTVLVSTTLTNGSQPVNTPELSVAVGSGAVPISSELTSGTLNMEGRIEMGQRESNVDFEGVPDLTPGQEIRIDTRVLITPHFNAGEAVPNNTVISVETQMSGIVNGQVQQTTVSTGIQNQSSNLSQLLFRACDLGELVQFNSDSWNASWADYDNDGWDDLFIADKSPDAPNRLYRNNGNGTFTRRLNGSMLHTNEKTVAGIWGDIDNDGFPELLIVNATGSKSKLYKNNSGSFEEMTESGLDKEVQYFHGAAFFDYDNDGFLDLLMTNFFETKFHQLYRNNGNGTFARINNTPITGESNRSTAPVLADFNNDGLVDVFIPNGNNQRNSLFVNRGNGKFDKVNGGAIANDQHNSVGAAWGDYDNDGWIDLLVVNASNQPNVLYRNNGNGAFSSLPASVPAEDRGESHAVIWTDTDNDGHLDLYVTNDKGLSFFYRNDGQGGFIKKYDEPLLTDFGKAMGIAGADFNRDGRMDFFVATHSGFPNRMFCNQSDAGNGFLSIRLNGTASNKQGVGARIRVKSNGQWQTRQVLPVQGLGSQSSLRQHFGLSNAAAADSILVHWPSGYVQTLTGVQANQFITITEEASNVVRGLAFHDLNNDCRWNEDEPLLEGPAFKINPINTSFASGAQGAVQLRLGQGAYQISLVPNAYWSMECPATLDISGQNGNYDLLLPLLPKQLGADLATRAAITVWRRGFKNETVLSYQNKGTSAVNNVQLRITYPANVHLLSADTPWATANGNLYTWNLGTLQPGSAGAVRLQDSVLLSAIIGDTYVLSSAISAPASTDIFPGDNNFSETHEIVGAIDPNDMLVTPKGRGREGFIPRDQKLTYTIRFQNVGTYYASRVVLENQLPKPLDQAGFRIEAVSHPGYRYTVDDKGLLRVVFDNINLPDSTRNEAESHGFFKYSVTPRADIFGGAKIENNALIYFDFEDPIRTNTVLNTIRFRDGDEQLRLIVFPNPADQELNIAMSESENQAYKDAVLQDVYLYSAQGALLGHWQNQQEYLLQITVKSLHPGMYYLRAVDDYGRTFTGSFVKR